MGENEENEDVEPKANIINDTSHDKTWMKRGIWGI